jgi:hypothetical protein
MPISFVMELHYSGIGCLGFVTRNTTRERGCRRDVLGRKRTYRFSWWVIKVYYI